MIKFAKVINDETFLCEVGLGSNSNFYKSIGMKELDVKQSDIDNNWYLSEMCPMKSPEEKLNEAKQEKHKENLEKAFSAEENGTVLYKDAVFETNSTNISKLTAMLAMINAGIVESVQWLSKDDLQVELQKEDLFELGQLISEYTGALWNVQYLCFKEQIENAQTIEEINEINIEY